MLIVATAPRAPIAGAGSPARMRPAPFLRSEPCAVGTPADSGLGTGLNDVLETVAPPVPVRTESTSQAEYAGSIPVIGSTCEELERHIKVSKCCRWRSTRPAFDRDETKRRLFLGFAINVELGRHDSKPRGGSAEDWFDNDSYKRDYEKSACRVAQCSLNYRV